MTQEINKNQLIQKAKNFDNFMKDFNVYIAPYAREQGWFNHYSEVNFVPKHLANNADYNGHNPMQVTICLALQCKDWADVCKKTKNINVNLFGIETNL